MKKYLFCILVAALCSCAPKAPAEYDTSKAPDVPVLATPNVLSAAQQADGWKLLWDGKTTEGWRSPKSDSFPQGGWFIQDGELCTTPGDGLHEAENGGDIVTLEQYGNFILSVDFKITPGANSGIKYFVRPDLNQGAGSAIGCEFQILDDDLHPDAKLGLNGNRTLASLYDLIPAAKENAPFDKEGWNTAWIVVKDDLVQHWLNGVKVVEYTRNNQLFNALVSHSKYKIWPDFGNQKVGNILLQEHGAEVHYRNVILKEL